MTQSTKEKTIEQPGIIKLDQSLTITEVSTLRETLKCYADSTQDISLDGSKVKIIDTTSMQLLLAFFRHLESNNCYINWLEPSEPILNIAKLLGVDSELGLDALPS